jgi:Bacterial Ig-like domain/PAP2 superfamily/Putative Ig domain/Bacterial Ig-like domain (group 3)
MNTANLLGNSNTQNVFAQPLLADASLLGGNVSLGITTQQPLSPLAAPANVPATTPLTPQALLQSPLAFSNNTSSLASTLPISSSNSAADPLTGSPLAASSLAAPVATSAPATPNFSIMAEGKVTVNGGSDFDGLPLDLSDDALIYAGLGFKMAGSIVLPTQRNASGTIITDAAGKSVLVNNALTVGPNYTQSSISGGNNYAGLNPPPVLSGITVDVPDFAALKQQELTARIPAGTPTVTFNATQNPTTTAALWNQKFPPGGTATQPKVVQVTGALTIPTGVTISNTVIIVNSGNITLSGSSHTLNNVTLIANNGSVILANAQAKDTSVLASGSVTMNGAARFDGKTLIANGTGDLIFNGATKQIDATQDLTVVSQGNITYNGAQNTRGTFLAKENFTFNGNTQLFGRVKAKGDITFNGGTTFTGIGGFVNDTAPPTITAALSRDTAPNNATNTDKITNDPTIVGSVTDLGQITEFKASLNTSTGYISVLPQRLADGTFTLTKAQLTQVNGGTLPDGPYTLNLQAKDQAGNISNFQYSFTLDTTVAVPTNLDLLASSDSGSSNADNITKINTPVIAGKADAGTTVQLLNGAVVVGQATANATGDWQITTSSLNNGTVSLTAIASDVAGNLSVASAPIVLTIDSVQPQVTLTTPTNTALRDGAKLTGTINGTGSAISTVTYRFDSATDQVLTINASGAFDQAIDFTGITNGAHILTIIATDVAGNVTTSTDNVTVTLDQDAPVIAGELAQDTGASGTDLITFNPAISGAVTDFNAVTEFRAGFNTTLPADFVDVLPQRLADGTFSFTRAQLETIYGGTLPQGASTLKLQAKDALGNLSAVFSITFTFDSALPQLTLTTPVNAPLKNNATLVGSLDGTGSALVSATYKIDNGTAIPIILTNGAFNQAINFAGVANGAHVLTITATDVAGNVLTSANNITVAQDADAPVIAAQLVQDSGSSGTDKITFNPNISGTVLDANAVATFQAAIDTGSFISILPQRQPDGSFTLTRTQLETVNAGALLDGLHTVKLSAIDEFGNASAVASIVFTLDTTVLPPNTLKLTAASDTGVSTTDNITQVNTPTITGLAEPNSTVQLFNGATLLGTATANAAGAWQVTTAALTNGTQTLTAIATDVAGNISQPSTTLSIVVDTLLPQLTVSTPVAQPLLDAARLTGSLDGTGGPITSATYRFDTGTEIPITLNATTGAFDQALNFTGITNGAHTLTISSTDTAGNILNQTYNVTVALDQNAPVITAILVQDSGSSTTDAITFNPAVSGTVTDLNAVASFKAGFNGAPTASFIDILPQRQADGSFTLTRAQLETMNGGTLPDGAYTLKLQAQDALGNVSAVFNLVFRLDTVAPDAPVLDLPATGDSGVSNTDNITKINPATINGAAEAGSAVQVFVDGVAATSVTSDAQGNWQFNTATLSEGGHAITAQATDVAGNVSALSAALSITIDSLAPTLTVTTPLETAPLINGARLVGSASGTGSAITTAQYRFDSGAIVPVVLNAAGAFDQAIDLSSVTNGAHTFTLSLTDAAGNVTNTTYNVTVNQDTAAPIIAVALAQDSGSSATDKLTNNATITGTVTDDMAVTELLASFSPTGTYANITTALTGSGFTLSPTQLGAINGGTLPDGAYTLYLKAKDSFGNLSTPITFTFTLDTTAPVAPGVDLPASSDSGVSNTDNITKVNPTTIIGTAEVGSQVNVLIDGTNIGTVASDGTWQVSAGTLTEGAHTVSATVTDAAGNISQAGTLNLQIDSVLPGLTVTTVQNNGTLFSNSRLTGQVDGTGTDITQLFYFFDNQVPQPITAAANGNFDLLIDFQGMTNGAHILNLVTTDRAGNSRALQYTVTVNLDDVAPLLNIELANDTAPNGTNTDHVTYDATIQGRVTDASGIASLTASFGVGASATFVNILPQVGVDGRFTLNQATLNSIYGAALPDGQYTLRIAATDSYGNRRESDLSFKLDRVAPRTPGFTLAPNSDTGILNDAKTQLGSVSVLGLTEAGAYVRSVQQPNVSATANPIDTLFIPGRFNLDGITLNLGENALTLEAFDLAGNRSTFTSTLTQIVDDGGDVVLDWNATTIKAVEYDRTTPPRAAYNMALVHTAVFDAVNAIEQDYQRYQIDAPVAPGTSPIAAAAAAAHRVLSRLYPLQVATFNAQLALSLTEVANGAGKDQGIALGQYVADALLNARLNDGANAVVPYAPGSNPGDWQPTGESYSGSALPQWPTVRPFGLSTGDQFRPDGPPALDSAEYAAEFNQVKLLGAKTGSTRTADQTQIAQFWSDGNGTYTPPGHWNQIAEAAALSGGNSLMENARLFALLNVSLADAGIASWDAKYTYEFWRPVTAIRQADTDNNAATIADANWQSLLITPNHPDYVSGHSTFSGAAETVLSSFFGENYSFTSSSLGLPGVYRTFSSFDAAAEEAGISRIYGGIHFNSANQEGLTTGRQVGQYIFNQYFRPVVTTGLQAGLANDTAAQGLTNQDGITSDVTIAGTIAASAVGSVAIQARFGDATTFQTIPVIVQANGQFTISPAQLATILGTALADGSYTLNLRAIDASNNVLASQAVTFKLDATAPTVNLQSPIVGAGHSATARAIGQVLDANGTATSARYSIDGGAFQSLPVDAQGKFDKRLVGNNLSNGSHQLVLETSDAAGNIRQTTVNFTVDPNLLASNATNAGWAIQGPNGIVLAEGSSFTTQASVPVVLGQTAGTRTISFNLEKSFDLQDTNAVIQDRLLVYLVDPQNTSQTLLDGGEPGTAVFSLAGQSAEYVPGRVAFNGSIVTIDVSSLGNRTDGILIFQLVNNDGDTKSTVRLSNLTNVVDLNGTPTLVVPPTVERGNAAGAIAEFTEYRPTANAEFLVSSVHLDAATGKYVADLRIRNTGDTPLSRNLAVLFPDLPLGVTVVGASGIHPAGSPYLNLASLLPPGDLAPGLISPTIQVVFNNPGLAQFDLLPVVLTGQLDRPPTLASLGNLTVQAGSRLEIPLVATDPDGNRVTLSMRPQANLPTGRLQANGRLVFTPSPDQVGTYTFTLVAKSGNLETTQSVTLTVVDDPITTTRISGSVLNTDQAPLAGVLVSVDGWEVLTDAMGNFTIELPYLPPSNTLKVYANRLTGGTEVYPFIAEKLPLMLEHPVYQGVNNVISRPIYLPPLDIANGVTIDPNQDVVVTTPNLPGAAVMVKAGTLSDKNGQPFTNKLSITAVPTNLTPAALPDTLRPGLVVTIQPGDMVFDVPAPLTLPNVEGYAAGSDMDLWSINPVTGVFDRVGLARVSADGSVIETIEGGVRNSSWHFVAPPPPECPPTSPDCGCNECEDGAPFTSEVSTKSGGLTEVHSLVSYSSLGESRGVQLVYDSLRADARPIIRYSAGGIRTPGNLALTADVT